jgi:hypothetical protein
MPTKTQDQNKNYDIRKRNIESLNLDADDWQEIKVVLDLKNHKSININDMLWDQEVIDALEKFQKKYDLTQDGILGPMTYTRIATAYESLSEFESSGLIDKSRTEFLRVSKYDKKRKLERIVTHWDACLNAESCIKVLLKRKVSTHFVIDNDGTIIQLLPVTYEAWHASGHNKNSIGIDISNAYYTKYNDWYEKNVGVKRPVIKSEVHHSTTTHLGYYPRQLASYKKLVLSLCEKYNIPVKVPLDSDGNLITTVIDSPEDWKGIMCHYHLTRNKIDCQGLRLDEIFKQDEEK